MDQKDLLEIIATYATAEEHAMLAAMYGLKNTFKHVDHCTNYQHPLRSVVHSALFIKDLIHPSETIIKHSTYKDGKLTMDKLEREDSSLLSVIRYDAGIIHKVNGHACTIYRTDYVICHYIQYGMYVNDTNRNKCISTTTMYGENLSIVNDILCDIRPPRMCEPSLHNCCPRCRFGGVHYRS